MAIAPQTLAPEPPFEPGVMNFRKWLRKIDEDRMATLEVNAEIRREHEERLLRALDRAVLTGDGGRLRATARQLCAMSAWKWGMTEDEYFHARPLQSDLGQSTSKRSRIPVLDVARSARVIDAQTSGPISK